MAWICRRPLVGDHIYAGLMQAPRFYRNGLYLCSNGIIVEHPHYNTLEGKNTWTKLQQLNDDDDKIEEEDLLKVFGKSGTTKTNIVNDLFMDEDNLVKVHLEKEVPKRFAKLLNGEESWANSKQSNKIIVNE